MTVSMRKAKPGSVEALTGDRDLMKALTPRALACTRSAAGLNIIQA